MSLRRGAAFDEICDIVMCAFDTVRPGPHARHWLSSHLWLMAAVLVCPGL